MNEMQVSMLDTQDRMSLSASADVVLIIINIYNLLWSKKY